MREESIHICRYVLKSRSALNAKSGRREFEGALIRVGGGFGCLHPWPELGDLDLETLLRELKHGDAQNPLTKRALSMAALDGQFREMGRSVFKDREVPLNHATIAQFRLEEVEEAVRGGYWVLKIKGHSDYAAIANRLDELSRRWPALRWRIDFNGVLSKSDVLRFVQCLTDHVWKRIDFLEDPCPYSREDWEDIRHITSLDLALDDPGDVASPAAQVLVLKPARQELSRFAEGRERLVVTSSMDHPLGQCFAAVQAATLSTLTGRVDSCGLQTHGLFEPDGFSERFGCAGPRFQPPGGTGLGFDDLLEKLPWKRLK